MTVHRNLALGLAAAGVACLVHTAAAEVVLYSETFEGGLSANGYTAVNAVGGFSGTFDTNTTDAATGADLPGDTGVFIGGATTDLAAFTTTVGAAGSDLTPIPTATPGLTLSIYANLQGATGSVGNDPGFFAVEVDGAWFVSASPLATPTATDPNFDLRTLSYADASFNALTIAGGDVVVGGPVARPTGSLTGVGIVQGLNNAAGDFTSQNYALLQISAVPEPTTLAAGVLAGTCLLARRRQV